jgi:hypothetical protein
VFLIIAFLSALALSLHAAGAAFDGLVAGLAALPKESAPPVPPAQPPVVDPGPPPSAIAGETYAEFFARSSAPVFGPDGHEISGFHVFDGEAWAPQTA